MTHPTLVARLFDRGPFVRAAGGGAADVILAGKVAASQGGAFAAAAVPVIVDGKGRLVPSAGGAEAGIDVAKLYRIRPDHALAFQLRAKASWWNGVEGVLTVLLYELDLGEGVFGRPLEFRLSMPEDPVQAWPRDALDAIHATLVTFLSQARGRLEAGVVRLSAPRLAESPERETSGGSMKRSGFAGEMVFALASCQYPAGMIDHATAHASYRRLSARLKARDGAKASPGFVLLLGDQIYADATAGLFDPSARFDRYERPYDVFQALLTRHHIGATTRLYTMLDDHEIDENWEPRADGGEDPYFAEGRAAYLEQRRLLGPDLAPPVGGYQPLWYPVTTEALPLFVADTRTEREPRRAATVEAASILHERQWQALEQWLQAPENADRPKFLASPAIFLPRRLRAARAHPAAALRSDAWDGYPASLYRLLALIADQRIRNVVFLSGDEHLSCVAEVTVTAPDGAQVTLHSVHSSALHAPFPFANSSASDLATQDRFSFAAAQGVLRRAEPDHPGAYVCEVRTLFLQDGDGFAVLHAARDEEGRWRLKCEFDRAEGVYRHELAL